MGIVVVTKIISSVDFNKLGFVYVLDYSQSGSPHLSVCGVTISPSTISPVSLLRILNLTLCGHSVIETVGKGSGVYH